MSWRADTNLAYAAGGQDVSGKGLNHAGHQDGQDVLGQASQSVHCHPLCLWWAAVLLSACANCMDLRAPLICIFSFLQSYLKLAKARSVSEPALTRTGFNRTGFVVCAYLVLVCGLSVQEALANFAAARPPGVKHEKFVVEVRIWQKQMPPQADCAVSVGAPHSTQGACCPMRPSHCVQMI